MPNENTANLMVTAFYTAQTWYWAGLDDADLFNSRHGRRVFRVANALMTLARAIRPGLPSLPHALVQRHVIIDRLYEESREMQVLELAAGFSRRGATYSRSQDVDYVEVDLAPVIDRKRRLLKRSEEGRLVLHRKNLHFRIGDVTASDLRAFIKPDCPAFVIAEGLLVYLDAGEQRRVWTRIAALLASLGGGTFVFDLTPASEQPEPSPVLRVLGWIFCQATNGTTMKFDNRIRQDIARELGDSGFDHVEVVEPATAPLEWKIPHLDQPTRVRIFRCQKLAGKGKTPPIANPALGPFQPDPVA